MHQCRSCPVPHLALLYSKVNKKRQTQLCVYVCVFCFYQGGLLQWGLFLVVFTSYCNVANVMCTVFCVVDVQLLSQAQFMLVSLLLSCNFNQCVIICFCHLTSRIYLYKSFFLFIFIVLKLYFTLSCNPFQLCSVTLHVFFPLNLLKPADLELIAKLRLFTET